MRRKLILASQITAIVLALLSAEESRPAPLLTPPGPPPWGGQFRSLGKMWEWHTLLAISPDGKKLVLGGRSNILAVYDLTTGKVAQEVRTNESVQDAAFSPDGKLFAVAEWREGFTLRDAATMKVLDRLSGSGKLGAWQVRFSRDSKRLICYSWWGDDKQFWSYDLEEKKEIGWPVGKNADTAKVMMREGLRGWGNYLFSVERERADGYYTGYKVWVTDPTTGKPGLKVTLGEKDYFQFDLSPDGTQAVVMQPGEDARIVDLKTSETVCTLGGHERWVSCAAFSRDGQLLATASGMTEDGHARIYTKNYPLPAARTDIILHDTAKGKVVARLPDKEKMRDFSRIGFSPDGKYLFAITRDHELMLWGTLPAIPTNADPLPTFDTAARANRAAGAGTADRFDDLVKELAGSKRTREQKVEALFLAVIGRPPTQLEQNLALKDRDNSPDAAMLAKLLEALVASPEFKTHVENLQKRLPKNRP